MTRRREFSPTTKRKRWDHAMGKCEYCAKPIDKYKAAHHFDHLLPCALGGDNSFANCRLACAECHAAKTGKEDVPRIRKADRQKVADIGAKALPARPLTGRGFVKREKPKRIELPPLPRHRLYTETP